MTSDLCLAKISQTCRRRFTQIYSTYMDTAALSLSAISSFAGVEPAIPALKTYYN